MERISSHNSLQDQIDTVVTPELVKLSGFIFNYDDNSWYNRSLFRDYLEVEHEDFLEWDTFVLSAKVSLNKKREAFEELYGNLLSSSSEEIWELYEYYTENFSKLRVFFELLELYIPFEAEKIYAFQEDGDRFFWPNGSKESHLQKINELEEEIFWKKISDSPNYAAKTIDYIYSCYDKNKSKLSADDHVFFSDCMNKIHQSTWISGWSQSTTEMSGIDLLDPLSSQDVEILEKEIPREDYVKIFELVIEILWLDWVKIELKDVKNISVSPESINIPSKASNFDTLKVSRIIWLIAHELERHAIWNANNQKLIWNLKSLSYLWQEEWVAHVMEYLALGYDLNSIPMNRYMPRMLAGEILNGKDFKRFLHIMNVLDWQSINVDNFFARFKRWRDFNLPGVNPKEKLYWIWALEIISRLRWWENPLWFFLAKNSSSEQETIKKLVVWENEVMNASTLREKWIILPLMLWDLIRFQLTSGIHENEDTFLRWFMKYFYDRYGELFEKLGLSYRDFIVRHIKSERDENKEKVSQILDIIKS